METKKLSNEEIVKFLYENCYDESKNCVYLRFLDFRDYNCNVNVTYLKVNGDLRIGYSTVSGDLYQAGNHVQGDLIQNRQRVGKNLIQDNQIVRGTINNESCQENLGDYFDKLMEDELKPVEEDEVIEDEEDNESLEEGYDDYDHDQYKW